MLSWRGVILLLVGVPSPTIVCISGYVSRPMAIKTGRTKRFALSNLNVANENLQCPNPEHREDSEQRPLPSSLIRRRRVLSHLSLTASSSWLILCTGAATTTPPFALALTPEEAATDYNSYAPTYDDLDGGPASDLLGIEEARIALFRQAFGRVLEVGCGTGLNLAKYDLGKITSLTLLDVSPGMLQEAQERLKSMQKSSSSSSLLSSSSVAAAQERLKSMQKSLSSSPSSSSSSSSSIREVPVTFVQADATSELVERFGTASFDTVVDSFSFCVMGNQGAKNCLHQMSKVVRPKSSGGQILLLENTRSSNPLLGWYQDATAEAAASVGGKGCLYNQDVNRMIHFIHGMEIIKEEEFAAGVFRSYQCQVIGGE